jgi:hypothetical protein
MISPVGRNRFEFPKPDFDDSRLQLSDQQCSTPRQEKPARQYGNARASCKLPRPPALNSGVNDTCISDMISLDKSMIKVEEAVDGKSDTTTIFKGKTSHDKHKESDSEEVDDDICDLSESKFI